MYTEITDFASKALNIAIPDLTIVCFRVVTSRFSFETTTAEPILKVARAGTTAEGIECAWVKVDETTVKIHNEDFTLPTTFFEEFNTLVEQTCPSIKEYSELLDKSQCDVMVYGQKGLIYAHRLYRIMIKFSHEFTHPESEKKVTGLKLTVINNYIANTGKYTGLESTLSSEELSGISNIILHLPETPVCCDTSVLEKNNADFLSRSLLFKNKKMFIFERDETH